MPLMPSMPLKTMPVRIIIYSKDVQNITGKMPRTARKMLQDIRLAFGKANHEMVTVKEFCGYTGIDEELVKDFLQF